MSSVNAVFILGHLGADPEVTFLDSGRAVCNFSLATNETWIDKDENKQERTEWHRIVVWGKQAEACGQYLRKGRMAHVSGRLQTRSWEDGEGVKKYMTEIVADRVQFVGGATKREEDGPPAEDETTGEPKPTRPPAPRASKPAPRASGKPQARRR